MELIEQLRKELRDACEGAIPDHILEKIIDEYLTDPHNISNIERELTEAEPELIIYNWVGFFLMDSGYLLFDQSVKKFGIPLWNGAAWQSKHCHKMCPIGDYCGRGPKKVYTIEGHEYCIGQLIASQEYRTQCTFNIPQLTDKEQLSEIEKMRTNFIFEFGPFTVKFGYIKHRYYRKINKYPGGNVIPFL